MGPADQQSGATCPAHLRDKSTSQGGGGLILQALLYRSDETTKLPLCQGNDRIVARHVDGQAVDRGESVGRKACVGAREDD